MKRQMFFAISGAVGVLFGLGFLLLPAMSLATYGSPTDPHHLLLARYFGATLLAFGLVVFLARETGDAIAVRALLVAGIVGDAAGAVISAAAAGRLLNAMAWTSVAIYVVFLAGGLYYLLRDKPKAISQSA